MLAVLLATVIGGPSPHTWELEWAEASRCRADDRVRARIQRVVGHADLRRLRIDVRDYDGSLAAHLELETPNGRTRRTFVAMSCDQVYDVIEMLTAFQLDSWTSGLPDAEHAPHSNPVVQHPQSTPATPPATGRRTPGGSDEPGPELGDAGRPVVERDRSGRIPETRDGPTVSRPTGPTTPRELGVDLRLGMTAGYGRRPLYDLGPSGEVGLGGRGWRVALGGAWRPAQSVSNENVGGRFDQWSIVVAAGPRWRAGRAMIGLVGGLEIGQMRGTGTGGALNRRTALPWFAAAGGADLTIRLGGPFSLWVGSCGFVSLLRQTWRFDDSSEVVYDNPRGGFSGDLGLEVRFE